MTGHHSSTYKPVLVGTRGGASSHFVTNIIQGNIIRIQLSQDPHQLLIKEGNIKHVSSWMVHIAQNLHFIWKWKFGGKSYMPSHLVHQHIQYFCSVIHFMWSNSEFSNYSFLVWRCQHKDSSCFLFLWLWMNLIFYCLVLNIYKINCYRIVKRYR